MTTHSRTRMLRAGVVMAVAAGTVAVLPAPASAAKPTVQITSLANGSLKSGEKTELSFQVTNNPAADGEQATTSVTVNVSLSFGEVVCQGRCDFTESIPTGESRVYTVTLVARTLDPGVNKGGKVQISATVGPDNSRTDRPITVTGPEVAPMIKDITGKVRDANSGRPVSGAAVVIRDTQQHVYDTRTDKNGNFKFVATVQAPIIPGAIDMLARKDGFTDKYTTVPAKAGESVKASLQMVSTTSPSPTVTPTATADPTPGALAETGAADALAAPPPISPVPAASTAAPESGGGSLLYILLGGLLVAAGVGAIVLVLLRRKDPDAEADDEAAPVVAAASAPAAAGVYHGASDAGRAAGQPVGADATMISRGAGAVPPSLADAPTMLQRAVPVDPADEFPDPYGAPLPGRQPATYGGPGQPGGWDNPGYAAPAPGAPRNVDPTRAAGMAGAAAGAPVNGAYRPADTAGGPPPGPGYGQPHGGGYGAAGRPEQYRPSYPAPSEPNAYPPAPGGYGERYDDPTGRYEPPPGGYAAPGYRPDPPGYGPAPAADGYGPPAGPHAGGPHPGGPNGAGPHPGAPRPGDQNGFEPPAGGYGAGGRYGGAAPAGGYAGPPAAYGSPAVAGYEPTRGRQPGPEAGGAPGPGYPAAAGQNGYDQPTGYDQPAHYADPSDYAQPGGYPQPGGYDARTGYDRTPPRQPAGPPGGPEHGGYYGADQDQQPPSRHGAPPAGPAGQPPIAEQRRPLDWLDD